MGSRFMSRKQLKDIHIIRIKEPFTFRVEHIMDFLKVAFENSMVDDFDNLFTRFQEMSLMDDCAIFLGQENLEWKGLCVILPVNLMKDPQVFHFYCAGSVRFRKELVKTSLAWIKEQGYSAFYTSNTTGSPDSVFKRMFNKVGNAEKVGTVFRFEV